MHEIRIRNQVIYLDPPIELARQQWLGQFQAALGIVCNLTRIRSSRYEISLRIQEESPEDLTYLSLVRLTSRCGPSLYIAHIVGRRCLE